MNICAFTTKSESEKTRTFRAFRLDNREMKGAQDFNDGEWDKEEEAGKQALTEHRRGGKGHTKPN